MPGWLLPGWVLRVCLQCREGQTLCFSASLPLCFSAFLLLCFCASVLLCFSAFPSPPVGSPLPLCAPFVVLCQHLGSGTGSRAVGWGFLVPWAWSIPWHPVTLPCCDPRASPLTPHPCVPVCCSLPPLHLPCSSPLPSWHIPEVSQCCFPCSEVSQCSMPSSRGVPMLPPHLSQFQMCARGRDGAQLSCWGGTGAHGMGLVPS